MVSFTQKDRYDYEDLLRLVTFLRSEDGCPWDHAQTHASIRRNLLEEAYEACEGIDRDDAVLMQEELGDVLLQVVFHADIERQRGRFDMDDICDAVCKKLIFRHPHLFFGGARQDWDELKKREKGSRTLADTLDGVARTLPALIRAEKFREKAAKDGWQGAEPAAEDALARLRQAPAGSDEAAAAMGDLLMAAAEIGVRKDVDNETALQNACEAMIRRVAAEQPL